MRADQNRRFGSHSFRHFVRWFRRATGDPVDTDLIPYQETVAAIQRHAFSTLSNNDLRTISLALRERCRGFSPSRAGARREARRLPLEIESEAFALVREAACRAVQLDPFDTQMIAGLAMARGHVAELPTGEGKTLAAVFPVCLHALAGRGVHVLTFNDYLARRDASWMGPIYRLLGLSVGCVQESMTRVEKRAAYACDVTYATAKEAGFDFLRDR
ncbi:MAG: hypothetical protein JXO72_14590, partial [Vicinamibacteria bacterium]|nr:hypothetical protein [Vicinamibacteria bacterium]